MKFGGSDGNRLINMGKWALDIRRRLEEGNAEFEFRAFWNMVIQDGISRVMKVTRLDNLDEHGDDDCRPWEMDWFGGFLWVHELHQLTNVEARMCYFSVELMQFWSGVLDVVQYMHKDIYNKGIIDRLGDMSTTMKSLESMTELKQMLDDWASETLEKSSPLEKQKSQTTGGITKRSAARSLYVQELPTIPEEGGANEDRVQSKRMKQDNQTRRRKRQVYQGRSNRRRLTYDGENDNGSGSEEYVEVPSVDNTSSKAPENKDNPDVEGDARGRPSGSLNNKWERNPVDGFAFGCKTKRKDVFSAVRTWGNGTWTATHGNGSSSSILENKVCLNVIMIDSIELELVTDVCIMVVVRSISACCMKVAGRG